ncbi:DNA-binding protein NsdB [Kitasatospora sp. NBC_00458]|uniref:DNA-binding protein NsdB n=1 Tax=Kitasatospora sp. NBC_00458 TaxID=2903568 RepID=UPI002E189323
MSRGPNTRLADLFVLTGWSKGELARLVNRRGAAMGQQQLSTDTSRVRRWIEQGEVPRDPVPRVLAAVFTERLGRVVTTEDLGLERHRPTRTGAAHSANSSLWEPDRTAAVLTEFTGMDLMLNRRGLVGAGAALTAGAIVADSLKGWLGGDAVAYAASAPGPRPVVAQGGARPVVDLYDAGPVGPDEVEALERSVQVFRAWDAARGGGLQRKAVVGQLNEVGGLLTHRHGTAVEQRLWLVAANLAVLAGWMSHDVGLEPTAQKYFMLAAEAAKEAGDRPRAGEAISRAARQMVHLGRADDAIDLMAAAKAGGGGRMLPRTRAMLNTVEAWAHASIGQSQATRRLLGEAEDLFAEEVTGPPPSWMQVFDEAELRGMQALVLRTLAEHDGSAAADACRHAERVIALREGTGQLRSALFDRITLASVHWITGEPDAADFQVKMVMNLIGQNSSHRTWDRLREMYRLTARYRGVPVVDELRAELGRELRSADAKNRPRPS